MSDDKLVTTRFGISLRAAVYAEDSGFSAFAVDLPGRVSQGDTIEEAFANVTEAASGVIESHLADGTIGSMRWVVDGNRRFEGAPVAEREVWAEATKPDNEAA